MKLIYKDALVAEIERRIKAIPRGETDKKLKAVYGNEAFVLNDLLSFIDTLEVKEVYVSNPQFPHLKDIIDKVFGAGNLEFWEYDDAEQLVLLAKDEVISQVCVSAGIKKPYKDGNQWCILKGENIQEGICGFGDNIEDALVDFLRNIPKIPLEVKEVDLDKELESFAYTLPHSAIGDGEHLGKFDDPKVKEARKHGWSHLWRYNYVKEIAKHFFELGLKAQKGEL